MYSSVVQFGAILYLLILSCSVAAQYDYVVIDQIILEGNKHTKDKVIQYEMNVSPGDTILLDQLSAVLQLEEKRILNTRLFTLVKINIKNWEDDHADLEVNIQENWYIYPAPIFELADRSFNVWWQEQNRSLDRVNYGGRIDHLNLTGHKDRLKLKVQFGYVRKYELNYDYPYLHNGWGLSTNLFFSEQKEIGYITEGNKTLFAQEDDERNMLQRFRTSVSVSKRSGLWLFQTFRLAYHHNKVDDIVPEKYNSEYFLNGSDHVRFMQFEYDADYDRRVFTIYPEGGYRLKFNLKKDGFGWEGDYNNLAVTTSIEKYWKIKKRLIIESRLRLKANLTRDRISFANNTALGYGGNIVTGYDLYVIDGTDYVLHKNALKLSILDRVYNWDRWMKLRQFKKLSVKAWLRWNTDYGYVNERHYAEANPLNNQWLLGYGPAIDLLLYNSIMIQMELSFNEIGEMGFYIQGGLNF